MLEIFLITLIILAIVALEIKDLLNAVIVLAGFSLALAVSFYYLQAPDVALAEAAVGTGVSTALFVVAIYRTERGR
ncbi:MAG: DUF4040 domain-containing protein [Deltaproteobacteria bacterium]|nr:DUF4040 domain-containing protein [Deltaproteobacteria bacterium]